jgi:hypothetical protein
MSKTAYLVVERFLFNVKQYRLDYEGETRLG